MSKKLVLILAFLSVPVLAFAAPQHAHAEAGIPFKEILIQLFNLIIAGGIIYYFGREHVVAYFKGRKTSYTELLLKAEHAKTAAEEKRQQLQERIQRLEGTMEESLKKAKEEAAELKVKILKEAQQTSAQLLEDAERTAHYEYDKAINRLRQELVTQSLEEARETLTAKLEAHDQKRLQSEFVEKIQVVQ